jgi:Rrf2 family protein
MAGFVNVGEMGSLAVHVIVDLALLRETDQDARRTAQDIAESLQASVHTLQKVTRRLIAAGLIEGARGARGGLKLAKEPKRITLLQIIEAVDGPVRCNGCMFSKRVCPADGGCVFEGLTGGMESMVREYFSETTVAALRDMAMTKG